MQYQKVKIAGHEFQFTTGETLFTEPSPKYTLDQINQLVEKEGLSVTKVWQDENNWFSVYLLSVAY